MHNDISYLTLKMAIVPVKTNFVPLKIAFAPAQDIHGTITPRGGRGVVYPTLRRSDHLDFSICPGPAPLGVQCSHFTIAEHVGARTTQMGFH
jgi:hypothetical protein